MTTAKPKLMAGQTDSADDLIAELARLMAEDAQSDKPVAPPAKPIRIPGAEAPVKPALSVETQADNRGIRIPGPSATTPEPRAMQEDRSQRPVAPAGTLERKEPPAFSFEPRQAEPVRNEPVVPVMPQASAFVEPVVTRPEPAEAHTPEAETDSAPAIAEPMPALDQDSLADLIAAELSVPEEPEAIAEPTFEEPLVELDVTDEVPRENFPSEVDSFGIPPVFGLGSTPAGKTEAHVEAAEPVVPDVKLAQFDLSHEMFVPPPHHKAQPLPDPLEEIERLIGPAARAHQRPAAPSPALRSLATPTIPKAEPAAAAVPVQPTKVSSIEEAILAAAATSGARVEWVEPVISARLPDDEDAEPITKAPRRRILGMTRSLAGPLVATLLLAVAAVGLYTVLGLGTSTPDGPAPIVAADTTPIKEVPAPATDTADANQSVVFNEISGANTAASEQIVSRDQSDVDAVTQVAADDVNAEGLVNRKVRTVTVRPDGTIVSGGDSLAGSAMLPVDRPTVPDVPGADFSTPDMIANADAAASTPAAAQTPAVPEIPAVTPVQPGSTVQAVDLAGNPIAGKTAPVPLARPSNLPTQNAASAAAPLAATPVQQTQTATFPTGAPAQTPAPATATASTPAITTATGAAAPAYVQLSSQRSEEAARQSAQNIASRFGAMFNGASLEVQRVDLGERGIFYRVRVPANSLQSANAICSNVKASGGDCYTL